MSTVQETNTIWPAKKTDSKYEKCRNITEEIYKRINITFQIKKLETGTQSELSDHSEQVDSNELSNETDLFACDKTSISSSSDAERDAGAVSKFININNNEEKTKKTIAVCKRPRKRFRKRVKKRQSKRPDSDVSSDEAVPLSRMVELDKKECESESPERVMGVPIVRLVKVNVGKAVAEYKPKLEPSDKKSSKRSQWDHKVLAEVAQPLSTTDKPEVRDKNGAELRSCHMCSLSFRGERGLRRHMTMSHISSSDSTRTTKP